MHTTSYQTFKRRAATIIIVGFVAGIVILTRYAWLSFLPNSLREKLINQGEKQFEKPLSLASTRATIQDRNGKILAVSLTR
ncbi:MAG: hypothetical protein K2X39_02370, partial [Silvanigrellaceae bacterium]|nr:hypothetical protein [Silvanigrellaceae bacterium]